MFLCRSASRCTIQATRRAGRLRRDFDDWTARAPVSWPPAAAAALRRAVEAGFVEMPQPPAGSADFVVGGTDPKRISTALTFCADRQELQGVVTFGAHTMGPPGLVHGGALATVADACLALVPYWAKQWAVTASLSVEYSQPVPLLSTVHVHATFAKMDPSHPRKRTVAFTMSRLDANGAPEGAPLCTARALCVIPKGGVDKLHESAHA